MHKCVAYCRVQHLHQIHLDNHYGHHTGKTGRCSSHPGTGSVQLGSNVENMSEAHQSRPHSLTDHHTSTIWECTWRQKANREERWVWKSTRSLNYYLCITREWIQLLLIVSTAELSAGAVGHTLYLKANCQTNEVIWALTSGRRPTRANQTQVTTSQVMVVAGIVT